MLGDPALFTFCLLLLLRKQATAVASREAPRADNARAQRRASVRQRTQPDQQAVSRVGFGTHVHPRTTFRLERQGAALCTLPHRISCGASQQSPV